MKTLTSIKVVQFFLYEKLDLQVAEITGIVGPNGSGKSSLLDAIQIAMFGANTRLSSFNAQADESMRNTRGIRSYCLGQCGDTEADRVRDRATTYITLVWKDTVTKELLSMGVCIYAGIEKEGYEVLGRYILRGVELTLGDHLGLVDGRETPREWSSFRQELKRRAEISGDDPLYVDSERYVRAVLLALRGSGGLPQFDAFSRAFRFALRMRFDKPVDDIVRNQVLEARPTNIKKFKEVTESFRRLAAMVADVEKRIEEASALRKDYYKASEEDAKSVTWKALACDAVRERTATEYDEASQLLHDTSEEHQAAVLNQKEIEDQKAHAQDEAIRFKGLREQHPEHVRSGALQNKLALERSAATSRAAELNMNMTLLSHTLQAAGKSKHLQDCRSDIDGAALLLSSLPANLAGTERSVFEGVLKRALKALDSAVPELFNARRAISNDIDACNATIAGVKDDIERCQLGRAPLAPHVRQLMLELRNGGLDPVPVCDVVRISNSAWQPVIEGYLGSNVQALLLAQHEEGPAFKIYRGLSGSRSVVGAKLVMASRYMDKKSPPSGSVAELIEGDNRAAVNYLRGKFGSAARAATDQECLASRHALSVDGMLISEGEIDRIQLARAGQFRIGAGSPEQMDQLRGELRGLTDTLRQLKLRSEDAAKLWDQLAIFSNAAVTTKKFLDVFDARAAAEGSAQSVVAQLGGTADQEYVRLGEMESEWIGKANTASNLATEHALSLGRLVEKLASAERRLVATRSEAELATTVAETARLIDNYDRSLAQKSWDVLLAGFGAGYSEMTIQADEQSRLAASRRDTAARAASNKLGQFVVAHKEQPPLNAAEDWRIGKVWVTELLDRLEGTTLADYKAQMEDALQTSQMTFRNDVALALNENLRWLDSTQGRLNDVLKSCPVFSNEERYRFKRTLRPPCKELYKFIESVAEHGTMDDLIGGPGDIPQQFQDLMDDKAILGSGSSSSPLDDYREFFEFDIEIYRTDPVTKADKVIGHLSKRLGSGSGGEHRAPLYVIAGAALASAYRLDGAKNGIRLMLLDEAFNKMDMRNITATMRYLEDLGLQVFMASPGENLGALTAFLHRYYDLLRDSTRNVLQLQGHDVSEETRQLFRSDLPEFNPELLKEELESIYAITPPDPPQVAPLA